MIFEELPDGAHFKLLVDVRYGMSVTYIKTMEDGPNHNAVRLNNSNQTIHINKDMEVIPVN